MENVLYWPWWAGGLAIGSFMFFFYVFTGNGLGISTGFVNLCKIALPTKNLAFFQKDAFKNVFDWKFVFVIGLIIGGLISNFWVEGMGGDFNFTKGFTMMEQVFPGYTKYIVLFLGGILVGFGARFAGGCTSGHAMLGNSQLELSSFISTICFMVSAFITVNILFRLFGGG